MADLILLDLNNGIRYNAPNELLGQNGKSLDWWDAQNVEYNSTMGLITMNGNEEILKLPAQVMGIFDYIRGNVHYAVATCANGNLYELNISAGTYSLKYSGLATTYNHCFANFNNGVIITDGVNAPVFYDHINGASVLTGSPPIGGLAISVYKGRVFIACGAVLYWCALGNQNNWTNTNDAGYLANLNDSSSNITALYGYGNYLVIHTENSVFTLNGSGPADFTVTKVADKGSVSPYGVTTFNNTHLFYNNGVYPLEFGLLQQIQLGNELSFKIHPEFLKLVNTRLNEIVAFQYTSKRQAWFYMPYQNTQGLTTAWIYDLVNNAWFKRVGVPVNCAAVINGVIYTGGLDGSIYQEDIGSSFNGNPINSYWYTPFINFGAPFYKKSFDRLIVKFERSVINNCNLVFRYNDNTTYQDTIAVSQIDNDLIWAESQFDDNGGIWGANQWTIQIYFDYSYLFSGIFETLQIGFSTNAANQKMCIRGFTCVNYAVSE